MQTPTAPSSTSSVRCEKSRLHFNSHNTDECKKRKRQEADVRIIDVTKPAIKRHRTHPDQEPVAQDSQRSISSASLTSHTPAPRTPHHRGGELPTPDATQVQTSDIEDLQHETIAVAVPGLPAGHQRDQHHELEDQGQGLGDIIMVDNSDIATVASSRDDTDTGGSLDTPAGTTIVLDTPLAEQPGLEVVENQDQVPDFVRHSYEPHNPFINRPPANTQFNRGLSAMVAADRERQNVHYTIRNGDGEENRDYQSEANQLRASRAAMREHLDASTALANTLHTKLLQIEGSTVADQTLLAQVQADLADARARIQQDHRIVKCLRIALGVVVVGVAMYAGWGWYNGPEMQYIRRRRANVLTE